LFDLLKIPLFEPIFIFYLKNSARAIVILKRFCCITKSLISYSVFSDHFRIPEVSQRVHEPEHWLELSPQLWWSQAPGSTGTAGYLSW